MKKQTKIWLLLFLIFLGTISTKTISNAAIANQKAFPNSSFPASGNNYCDDGIAIGVKTHYCCVNYATAAYKYIWGHSYYDDRNNRKAAVNYIGSLSSDARIATADNLKKIFANVTPGAYVRLSNESSIPANYDTEGEGHSFIFLGNTNTGAWVAEANYDNAGNAHVTELSWAEIAKKKTYIRYIIWPTAGKYNDELIGKYAPKGEFKVAVGGQGKIYVGGWAYDQDDMSKQIAVDVYIGAPLGSSGAEGHRITANSKDFSEGSGTYHGFSSWITTSKSGSKVPVYCYAVDLTGKANTYLSGTCLYVDISNGSTGVYAPKGEFKVAVGGEGEVYVGGWAYDEDDMSKNIAVDVYIGAPLGSSDAEGHRIRADSKDFSQGSGTDHGFSKWITTSKRGSHIPVYCYAVDLTLNSNTYLSGTALYVDIANPAVAGFDLNWSLDGKESALDQTFATADVYINGKLLADDCTDYANLFTVGATYAIDDIKAKPGYAYVGHTGELTGTITKGGNSVVLQFETVDVHEHIYTTTMTSPTCTVAGVQKYICECGDNYTESIAALGHDWNKAATVDVKPTCTEEGSQSIHCSKCSVTKDKETLPATGHQNIQLLNQKEASCQETGYTGDIYCSDCKTMISTGEKTEKKSHNIVDEPAVAATCTKDGSTGRKYCSMCNTVFQQKETIKAYGHDYQLVEGSAAEATCSENGKEADEKCSKCHEIKAGSIIKATGHIWDNGIVVKEATCTTVGEKQFTCSKCDTMKTVGIPVISHTYTSVYAKATLTESGYKAQKCMVCEKVKDVMTYSYPETIALSKTEYSYTAKVLKPTVTVIGEDGNVIDASNYTLTYSNAKSKNVGKYKIKISFKGNYSGSKLVTYTINPKSTTISKLSPASKTFTAKWTKKTAQTTGYQLLYALTSDFSDAVSKTIKKNTTVKLKISKLKSKKIYYVRVRTYKKINGAYYYSAWSPAKKVVTK